MCIISSARHPLLHSVQQKARWIGQDAYPSCLEVADEHERWLEFINSKGELARFLPRLRDRAGQRDDTLAEIGAGYFLEKYAGLPILKWEPQGANGKTGEYLVGLPEGKEMFVEVKARGWEDEVVYTEGKGSPRLVEPKYIDGDARATAPWRSVRETVKKAYPKMPNTMPTLLVICDDIFIALNDSPESVQIALYCPRGMGHHPTGYLAEDGCFVGNSYESLGGVGVLNVNFPVVQFCFSAYDNLNCLRAVALPRAIFSGYPRYNGIDE